MRKHSAETASQLAKSFGSRQLRARRLHFTPGTVAAKQRPTSRTEALGRDAFWCVPVWNSTSMPPERLKEKS
jgi:hypothetical protein